MIVRHPSLYLSHLPISHRKGMPDPVIALVPSIQDCGGYYRWPGARDDLTGCRRHQGLILIAEDSDIGATVTHEYRHHMQFWRHGKPPYVAAWRDGTLAEYQASIVEFFKSDPRERDALVYQNRHAPTDLGMEWEEWVRRAA